MARASREYPVLLTMLGDGRLHLSGIAKLAPHLTGENRDLLLARASHRSKRQIEDLIAELAPRPDAPALMRKLPERKALPVPAPPSGPDGLGVGLPGLGLDGVALREPEEASSGRETRFNTVGGQLRQLLPDGRRARALELASRGVEVEARELGPGGVAASATSGPSSAAWAVPSTTSEGVQPVAAAIGPDSPTLAFARPSPPAVIQALAPARFKVQFTASAELRDKLERLRALLRSEIPDGDLGAIIERAVTEKLERLEARRFARTSHPRKALAETDLSPSARRIPAAVRRAVSERDGNRCGYVDEAGRRCSGRDRLEYHHRRPFGLGGDHSPQNIGLVCRAHNAQLAEHDYGRDALARYRRSARHVPGTAGGAPAARLLTPVRASPPGT